jgi:hypothetical protein
MSTPIRPVEKRKDSPQLGVIYTIMQGVDDHERTNVGSSLKAMFPQIPAVSKKNRKHRLPDIYIRRTLHADFCRSTECRRI